MTTRISSQPTTMRKAPSQQRSRAMVDAILEAAARILALRGWAKFTTNEVAEVAGVSVGSLYQYFPDKLALAEAIRQRHLDAVLAALSDPVHAEIPVGRRVQRLVDNVIAAHSVDHALHKVLLGEVPLAGRATYAEFEARYLDQYRAVTDAARIAGGVKRNSARDAVVARVLAAAVEGVVHAAVRNDELTSPVLKTELRNLVNAYLASHYSRH